MAQIDILTDAFNYINQNNVEQIVVLKKDVEGCIHFQTFGEEKFLEIIGMLQVALFDYQQKFHDDYHVTKYHQSYDLEDLT